MIVLVPLAAETDRCAASVARAMPEARVVLLAPSAWALAPVTALIEGGSEFAYLDPSAVLARPLDAREPRFDLMTARGRSTVVLGRATPRVVRFFGDWGREFRAMLTAPNAVALARAHGGSLREAALVRTLAIADEAGGFAAGRLDPDRYGIEAAWCAACGAPAPVCGGPGAHDVAGDGPATPPRPEVVYRCGAAW